MRRRSSQARFSAASSSARGAKGPTIVRATNTAISRASQTSSALSGTAPRSISANTSAAPSEPRCVIRMLSRYSVTLRASRAWAIASS